MYCLPSTWNDTGTAVMPEAQWALRSDRGLTYAATLPEGSRLIAGAWWSPEYHGPALVSFDADLAHGMGLKVGDRFNMRAPALGNQEIEAEIKLIETRGEYAGWRATRATGDFDLRTFEVRAYPVSPLPALRPGMSVYAEWPTAEHK